MHIKGLGKKLPGHPNKSRISSYSNLLTSARNPKMIESQCFYCEGCASIVLLFYFNLMIYCFHSRVEKYLAPLKQSKTTSILGKAYESLIALYSLCSYFFWSLGSWSVHVCCFHLKMEFCSCVSGRQWCGIIHYHDVRNALYANSLYA